jgi:hypothetical protein
VKPRISVRWLPEAWERYQTLTPEQQGQARRLIAALLLSPTAGRFWHRDLENNALFIASAYDTHVIHRVLYRTTGDKLFILDVLVFPWEEQESA